MSALFISVFTFLTRIVFPIGTNILNMQLCFFPQYIVLFILGIFFFRKNLLLNIPYKLGMTWFKYTLVLGLLFWLGMTILGNAAEKGLEPFAGHFSWGNAAYSFWESFFCVGVCLGLIVWFRDKFNRQGSFGKFLSDNAFGVYVFHTPLLVFISMLMKDVAMYPFFKYLIVAITTIPVCFLASYIIRKIPGSGICNQIRRFSSEPSLPARVIDQKSAATILIHITWIISPSYWRYCLMHR